MIGKTTVIWLVLAAVASVVLFHTSYRVQELDLRLAQLNREIIREQEAIQVLKAEWSYLNDPTRIERLARTYTPLAPSGPAQIIASVEQIPFRPPEPEGPALVSAVPLPGRKPEPALPEAVESRLASAEPGTMPTAVTAASGQVVALPPDGILLTSFGPPR
jgi:cell division protein FtsL